MAVETKRGCGYRRVGGLYLVGGGLSAPCDRMPYPLDRCRTCGGGVKFTRGHAWLQPDFFSVHVAPKHPLDTRQECLDSSPCPVCHNRDDFGSHLLLWIGRSHYSPDAFLLESLNLGVSRRIAALPKGLVLGETWVLLAHLDAVPEPRGLDHLPICANCGADNQAHPHPGCTDGYKSTAPTPGIFCAFIPRAVELILKESDATAERREKEAKRGVTVVAVPDNDRDHQGSVWDKDEDSQPELPEGLS